MEKVSPVQLQDRIITLDIIRGFAILGIFIVNMGMINFPYFYVSLTDTPVWTGTWNHVAEAFILIFAQGKFYTMFSFLFGLGFILFIERAQQKVSKPKLLFLRRLIILFFIGVLHAYFLWFGDVLMTYAVAGLLLLAFYSVKPKTLIIWAVVFLSVFLLFTALAVGFASLGEAMNSQLMESALQKEYDKYERAIDSSLQAYGSGSFSDIMSQRIQDLKFAYSNGIFAILLFFPLFLIGAYAGKKKIFQNIQQNLGFIRKVWKWSFIIGISLNVLKYWSMQQWEPLYPSMYHNYQAIGVAIGDTALCLFYIASIVLLIQNQTWLQRLSPLAYVGRTAVSNYLFSSLLATSIFYSYGLGLYGKVGPAVGLILTLALFCIQLFLSIRWLRSYQYGPVEWVWRSLTYGKLQPFRCSSKSPPSITKH